MPSDDDAIIHKVGRQGSLHQDLVAAAVLQLGQELMKKEEDVLTPLVQTSWSHLDPAGLERSPPASGGTNLIKPTTGAHEIDKETVADGLLEETDLRTENQTRMSIVTDDEALPKADLVRLVKTLRDELSELKTRQQKTEDKLDTLLSSMRGWAQIFMQQQQPAACVHSVGERFQQDRPPQDDRPVHPNKC